MEPILTLSIKAIDKWATKRILQSNSEERLTMTKVLSSKLEVAGQFITQGITDRSVVQSISWDGKDGFGRDLFCFQKGTFQIEALSNALSPYSVRSFRTTDEFLIPAFDNPSFQDQASSIPLREFSPTYQTRSYEWIGVIDWRYLGLGGWGLDIHHRLDPNSLTLFRGDGTTFRNESKIVKKFAGILWRF